MSELNPEATEVPKALLPVVPAALLGVGSVTPAGLLIAGNPLIALLSLGIWASVAIPALVLYWRRFLLHLRQLDRQEEQEQRVARNQKRQDEHDGLQHDYDMKVLRRQFEGLDQINLPDGVPLLRRLEASTPAT